jgi:Rrf2 family protein
MSIGYLIVFLFFSCDILGKRAPGGIHMISTKGRYAIRVMIDIAENSNGGYVPLKDIAARQDISKKYLEAIGKELVSGGLLTAASGRSGGYKLSRAPEDYKISEILELMEGTLSPVACLKENAAPCPRAQDCKTLPMWQEYYEQTRSFFDSRTLSDLIV